MCCMCGTYVLYVLYILYVVLTCSSAPCFGVTALSHAVDDTYIEVKTAESRDIIK